MPEFILDLGSNEAAERFNRLDAFTRGYIEAMFFTETGDLDDGDLQHATVADLSEAACNEIRWNCRDFQNLNHALLAEAYKRSTAYDKATAGRDFWYTRNGHGVGFWCRNLGEVGDKLSTRCGWQPKGTPFPETDLYRGDDGLLYLT